MKRLFVIGFLIFMSSVQAKAQQYHYNQFTTTEGLPSNSVRSSLIDSRNWFWVGTDAGVARYQDGYFIADSRLDTLRGMRVWAMAEDDQNTIWIGTYGNGLARFDGDSLEWFNSQNSALENDEIRILKFLPELKQLLIGGKDVFAIYTENQLINFKLPNNFSPRHFVDFMEVDDKILALNREKAATLSYSPKEKKLEYIKRDFYPETSIWSGIITSSGELYYGFDRDSYYYKSADREFVKEGIGQVFEWFEDPFGYVWAAAWKAEGPGGLFRFNKGEMVHYNKLLGIEEINGWGLEYDQANNCLWFLSLDQGLIQLPLQMFSTLKLPFEKNISYINEIQQDSNENLWLSTNNSIWIFDGENFENIRNDRFIKALFKAHYDHFDQWYSVIKDPKLPDSALYHRFSSDLDETGNYSIYNLGSLLKLFNEEDLVQLKTGPNEFKKLKAKLFQELNAPTDQYEPLEFYTVLPLNKHKVLIVNNLGTFSYEQQSRKIDYLNPYNEENLTLQKDTLYYTFKFNLWVKRVIINNEETIGIPWLRQEEHPDLPQFTVASKAAAGRLWFASRFQGLFTSHNNQFIHLNKIYPELSLNFTSLEFDGDSLLYAGANNGIIYVFTNGQDTPVLLQTLSADNSLEGRSIQWLVNDRQGYLWAGTNSALNRINLLSYHENKDYEIRHFSDPQGYNSFDVQSATLDDKGTIWLDNDFNLLSINTTLANQADFEPFEIFVRQIDLFMKPVEWEKLNPANAWTKLPSKAVFQHDQNYFTFHFSNNNRVDPQNDHYCYRLAGLDTNWSKPSSEKRAVFTSLDPGKYTLEVRLCGPINSIQQSVSYPFIILKPWWKQWWFIGLYALTSLSLLYLFMNWRIRYQRNQQKRKYEVQQKLAELKLQALQAQMNPHFIFNVLTAIQNAILKNDIDNAISYLSDVSRLMRRTLDYASERFISLEEEAEYLENYLRLEKIRMNGKLQTEILIDPELDKQNTQIPPMLIQPLVENAIKHGASKAKEIGKISIQFEKINDKNYQCIVEDNGPGIATESNSTHISRGLDMIYSRIQLLNEEFGEENFSFVISNKVRPESGARMVVEMRI